MEPVDTHTDVDGLVPIDAGDDVPGGETVSSARLAEYVADGMADSTVRTAVSRLRKVVGDRLESGDGGYRLMLGNGELDVSIFDGMVEPARSASMPDRVEALDEAVARSRCGVVPQPATTTTRPDRATACTRRFLKVVVVRGSRHLYPDRARARTLR